jgi:uncharacterized protein YraI
MKRKGITLAAAVAGLFALPAAASALTAVTTEPVPLRAGPAGDFPVVDQIPGGVNVLVNGCVRAYRWCDVSWRDAHGWVRGDDLAYLESGRRVSIIEYGPRVSLPIIAFSVDSYWDRYYRNRPFYGRRAHFRTVWRDHDHRGDRRERRGERHEQLNKSHGYRNTDRDNDRSETRQRRDTNKNRTGEHRGQLKEQRGYRSMDRTQQPGRDGGLNKPADRPRVQQQRSNQGASGQSHGRPEARAEQRPSAGPTGGGGGGRGHGNAPGNDAKGR